MVKNLVGRASVPAAVGGTKNFSKQLRMSR
jgi:hypothetical protein